MVRTHAAWDAYNQKFWAWINTLPVPDYAWALENMPEETERRNSGYPDFIPWPKELTDLSEEYNNSTTLPANIEQGYISTENHEIAQLISVMESTTICAHL